jgi:hypothetical protein
MWVRVIKNLSGTICECPFISQYKAPIGTLTNEARVFTPKDTAVITPNSDTRIP